MSRLTQKQRKIIVIGIAVLIILFGFLNSQFKFNISEDTVDTVTMVLFVLAFALLFGGRKHKETNSNENEANSLIQENIDESEINRTEQDSTNEFELNNTSVENEGASNEESK